MTAGSLSASLPTRTRVACTVSEALCRLQRSWSAHERRQMPHTSTPFSPDPRSPRQWQTGLPAGFAALRMPTQLVDYRSFSRALTVIFPDAVIQEGAVGFAQRNAPWRRSGTQSCSQDRLPAGRWPYKAHGPPKTGRVVSIAGRRFRRVGSETTSISCRSIPQETRYPICLTP